MAYDYIIVGAGIAGLTAANRLADSGKKVLILDKKPHIGGQCFDYKMPDTNFKIHQYGPHIFHTDNELVLDYIKSFGDHLDFGYSHEVLANDGVRNFNFPVSYLTLDQLVEHNYVDKMLVDKLKYYAEKSGLERITISELMKLNELKPLANLIYSMFFKEYTKKQWGKYSKLVEKNVFERVPIHLKYKTTYFPDSHKVALPQNTYFDLFVKLVSNKNIDINLSCDALDAICFDFDRGSITFNNEERFKGKVIFTGSIDDIFKRYDPSSYTELPYRSIKFSLNEKPTRNLSSVVNFCDNLSQCTRETDFSYWSNITQVRPTTYVLTEQPINFSLKHSSIVYDRLYPISNELYQSQYQEMRHELETTFRDRIFLLGRCGTYTYLDMDKAILQALTLANQLKGN